MLSILVTEAFQAVEVSDRPVVRSRSKTSAGEGDDVHVMHDAEGEGCRQIVWRRQRSERESLREWRLSKADKRLVTVDFCDERRSSK